MSLFYFLNNLSIALAADVTLAWDPSSGVVDGYRVFERQDGESYEYSNPSWEGSTTTSTVYNLDEGVTHYFVVRAFNEYGESADSNEVGITFPAYIADQSSIVGSGGDSGLGCFISTMAPYSSIPRPDFLKLPALEKEFAEARGLILLTTLVTMCLALCAHILRKKQMGSP